jgi:LPS export ABC transporter protein LptC
MINRAFLLLVLFALTFVSCENDMRKVDAINARGYSGEDRATGVTIIYSKEGRVEARLFAKEFIRAEAARPPYTDARQGLRIEFYDSTLLIQSTVKARYARWYEGKGNVLLRRDVVVANKKGEELHTEELVWNEALKKFFTEKPVRIITPTQTLYGDGLEANQDFTWHKITNIKGMVRVDKSAVPAE